MNQITFHTLRHFKTKMDCHKTMRTLLSVLIYVFDGNKQYIASLTARIMGKGYVKQKAFKRRI
jgi:hypothetical protein